MKTITQLTFVVPMYDLSSDIGGNFLWMPTVKDAIYYQVFEFDYEDQTWCKSDCEEYEVKAEALRFANARHIELCALYGVSVDDPATIIDDDAFISGTGLI